MENGKKTTPNILLVMSDEFRYPRYFKSLEEVKGMTDGAVFKEAIKYVLAFKEFPDDIKNNKVVMASINSYFPGLTKLRENAVVLCNHTIAATACVPSRAVMFTGHYGYETKVTQTDGIFKTGDETNFPWLDRNGIPTTGDWFRAAGYETHYFGKCHFAQPIDNTLKAFGFDDWEYSFPEPHGSDPNNLGIYRDHGFSDLVNTFLRRKALALDYDAKNTKQNDSTEKPWFAVASFTNPHDITTFPGLLENIIPSSEGGGVSIPLKPLTIPVKDTKSKPPKNGTWEINLNPLGFPQDNADLSDNWNEVLCHQKESTANKPDCQFDFSLKMGIAVASKTNLEVAKNAAPLLGLPFQLTDKPMEWSEAYLQYYTYLHHVLDQHINRILQTLSETGLEQETIVVFSPDHGDYGTSHGMLIEKWHSAYQEAIHVPVVVKIPGSTEYKSIDNLTSHIDILPTLVGLTGKDINQLTVKQRKRGKTYYGNELIGADLSDLITKNDTHLNIEYKDGTVRKEVLFVTDDMITQPIDREYSANAGYTTFNTAIDYYKNSGAENYGGTDGQNEKWKEWTQYLKVTEGIYGKSVCTPCRIQCVRQDNWKLVRYFENTKLETGNQWELYNLDDDPTEMRNLLVYNGAFPTVHNPSGTLDEAQIKSVEAQAQTLKTLLYQLIVKYNAADGVPL